MNKKVNLLDCTLRDGGYVNDWEFGHSAITSTYKRLDAAGAEYIEVGFLDERRSYDPNRTIMPNTEAANQIYKNIQKKNAIPVAMIDYGTCSIENIGECDASFIDGIRVIFKKEKIQEALPFCEQIKEKGYKLFIQAISITAYSDLELLEYIEKINKIKPYAFSIVDTYGLLDKEKLTKYFYLCDNNLDSEIKLGYHAHNNFQLAFSNTIEFLSMRTKRELIADSTVYGMGKSAGNCATELLAMHMNQYHNKQYDISQILEVIDTDLLTIYKEHYWGYTHMFYISALHDCHPNYVKYLLDKKTLSISAINDILSSLPHDKKLLYDYKYIHDAYLNYQVNDIDDVDTYDNLGRCFRDRKVLVIGPGKTISTQNDAIKSFIDTEKPLIISVNFWTDLYDSDYIFISNAKRYSRLDDTLVECENKPLVISTSNVKELDYPIDFVLNYESLLMKDIKNADNALVLFLNFLIRVGVGTVWLAGFDGFKPGIDNYYERGYNYVNDDFFKMEKNEQMSQTLTMLNRQIDVIFITDTLYDI